MDVLPYPEDLVNDVERVDFELVVGITTSDEDFQIVFFVNLGIALGQSAPHVGLLRREAEIQVRVVPEKPDSRVEPCRFSGNDVYECVG